MKMTTGYIEVNGDDPYITLVGTESSNDPCGIREKAGNFEVYNVSNDTAGLTMAVSTGNLTIGGGLTVTTAKTDGQVGIPLAPGVSLVGTWTPSDSSNVLIVTRSTSATTDYYKVPIIIPHRTTATKGAKLKSVTVSYTMASADTAADTLQFLILKQLIPVDASGATGSVLAGDSDSDYDSSHNTDAKRLATASHTLTVTIPTEEQAYMADGEQLYLKVKVIDANTANLALVLTGAVANYDIAAF
jgi:hypothetical protein